MTVWNPDLTVSIGGTSFKSKTVNSINIAYGRTSVWEQPRTGYATIDLIQTTEAFINLEINAQVVITLKNSAGVYKTIFTGQLSSTEYSRQAQGLTAGATIITVTAIGPFAQMARKLIGTSSYPKEFDSARMSRILTEAGVTIDVVDTPAVYELKIRDGAIADAYSLAASTASEVFGYIYETPSGKVGYANQSRRLNDKQANGFFAIPASYVLWNTLSTSRSLNNLLNDITLEYRAGDVTATSAGSISVYGRQAGKFVTGLHNLVDAQNLANFYIGTRSAPQTNLSNFSIYLHTNQLTDVKRDALIEMYLGKPVEIPDLPASLYDGVFHGFVEGWRWTIDRMRAKLDLVCTDSTLSIVPTRWQDVDPLDKWNMVGSTIRWFEYE